MPYHLTHPIAILGSPTHINDTPHAFYRCVTLPAHPTQPDLGCCGRETGILSGSSRARPVRGHVGDGGGAAMCFLDIIIHGA
jgi:hypothetical protein